MGLPSSEKVWLKHFSKDAISITVPKRTIYEHLITQNAGHENDTAILYYDNKITYGRLICDIHKCASAFERLGVQKEDKVAVLSASIPEMICCLYGLSKIGATLLALDPRRSITEIRNFLLKGNCSTVVILDLAWNHVAEAMDGLDIRHRIIVSATDSLSFSQRAWQVMSTDKTVIPEEDGIIRWKDFLKYSNENESKTVSYQENHVAAVTLTGGTTGTPKGVMLSDDGFNAIAIDFQNCGVPYVRGQRFMDIIPMFSSYGIVSSLHMPLSLGLELLLIPRFDPNQSGKLIKKYRPSHTLMVPAHYEKLMNSKELKNFDLSFLVTAGSGGDTMNIGIETKLNQFLKDRGCKYPLSQGYGLSECTSAVSCCCNGNYRQGSVGYPLLTTTVGIFKPGTIEELEYDQEGEICVFGPNCMLGYLENEEETSLVMIRHADGSIWIHTGDIGVMDQDGFLYVRGRLKRTIARADGHKIFPSHIESIISMHPDVLECAVVGVQDKDNCQGKNAWAMVSLKSESQNSSIIEDLFSLCEQLEERARPEKILVFSEIPHTDLGKVDYNKIEHILENI